MTRSIDSFLSRDPKNMMYTKPWRKFLAEQDRRFKAQYRKDHPSYQCRWQLHQLNQRIYVANMAYFHAGLSPANRDRHERRQRMVVAAMSSALWNAVNFGPIDLEAGIMNGSEKVLITPSRTLTSALS